MCRASLQNEANKSVAEGVNDGIVYLMAIPYILVAGVFYAVFRLKQKKKEVKVEIVKHKAAPHDLKKKTSNETATQK